MTNVIEVIPNTDWGKTGYPHMLTLARKYPATHADNIFRLLEAAHGKKVTRDVWLSRSVFLNDSQFAELGERLKRNPLLSSITLPKTELPRVAQQEPKRAALTEWFNSQNLQVRQMLDSIDTIEFRLFTDGQEIAIAWEKNEESAQKRGWVTHTATRLDNAARERVEARLRVLQELVPETHIFQEGEDALILGEYIDGEHASDEDVSLFRQQLEARNIPEERFDFNHQNLLRTATGQVIYVDRDYLGISH